MAPRGRRPIEREVLMLPEQRRCSAAFDQALFLALGAPGERTQPTEIAVRPGRQQEHVDLVVGHADAPIGRQFVDGPAASFLKSLQAVEVADPGGQVHILALVPQLDSRIGAFHGWDLAGMFLIRLRGLKPSFLAMRTSSFERRHRRLASDHWSVCLRLFLPILIPSRRRSATRSVLGSCWQFFAEVL